MRCKNSLEKVRDLESEKCGSSAKNNRQVVGGETKKMNASSLNKYVHYMLYVCYVHFGQIPFDVGKGAPGL